MNILMHCVYYPPEIGGLESHVHHLCRALVEHGHKVDVITSRSMAGTPRFEVMDGVEVHRTWFPGKNALGWLAHAAGSLPPSMTLARDADILHAQAFQSIPPLLAARARVGVPLVSTWHTSHFLRLAEHPITGYLLGRLVQASDANLAASAEIASTAERLAPRSRVRAVTNGVDTALFKPGNAVSLEAGGTRRRLVVPRRLFRKNGVEFAIRALPIIAERHDVEMLIIGDGPERKSLESLASNLNVQERIQFIGTQAHSEIPMLISRSELAVFPSLMEATSVAALECMSCEVPVAASRVGGLPEIVDDDVGGLFEPGNAEDLAFVVGQLLDDPALASKGRVARSRVLSSWSNDRLAQYHLELYEKVIRRRCELMK